MFKDKFVFSQIVFFLDRNKFNYIVRKYGGDKYIKHFAGWNQPLYVWSTIQSGKSSRFDSYIGGA